MRTKTLLLLLAAIFRLTTSLSAKDKYAIGLFHFNLQYVAGDYKIERRIIRESLYPVLQFFDSHPKYKSDIEIQGYGIEVLAQEHPDVLALLKKLVQRGQIELVIAHYSDQLFIGYPALDLQRSINFSVRAQSYTVQTGRINDSLYRMDIECLRPADGAVEIAFETAADGLEYSASCGEGVRVHLSSTWEHDPAFALTNGFIYLNNGYSLIKDCTVEHLAATWKVNERKLVFREELREGNGSMRMRFYLRKGSAEAGLRFANRLNPFPSYRVDNGRDGFLFTSVAPE